jgi:ribosomal protein S18 acetylase RimI-like enzyme
MQLTFETAVAKDIPIIAQLAEDIWKMYYPEIITMTQIDYMLKNMYSAEELLNQINAGHVFTLIYADRKPIGYVSISTVNKKNYFIHKFYIKVAEHKKGIGSQVFNYILKQLNTVETIELTVNRQNYKAINFYFKNGFVIKRVADFDIGDGFFMTDFVMVKNS